MTCSVTIFLNSPTICITILYYVFTLLPVVPPILPCLPVVSPFFTVLPVIRPFLPYLRFTTIFAESLQGSYTLLTVLSVLCSQFPSTIHPHSWDLSAPICCHCPLDAVLSSGKGLTSRDRLNRSDNYLLRGFLLVSQSVMQDNCSISFSYLRSSNDE